MGAGVPVEIICGPVQGVPGTNTFSQSADFSLFLPT